MSTFERTILMSRIKDKSGTETIKRLGWEMLSGNGFGAMISQVPISPNQGSGTATTMDLLDMYYDENLTIIDPVTKIEFFDSEADFTNRFDNVTAMYNSSTNVSGELGYPRY